MALFAFLRKKNKDGTPAEDVICQPVQTCSCGHCQGDSTPEAHTTEADILVLGACCKKSSESFANVQTAVAELGLPQTVQNIGDVVEIARYGVMQTPALVVNRKVMSYGKLISVAEAKRLIQKAGVKV